MRERASNVLERRDPEYAGGGKWVTDWKAALDDIRALPLPGEDGP